MIFKIKKNLNNFIRSYKSNFKIKKKTEIFPDQICNFSKIPITIKDNFLFKISEICKKERNEKKAWDLSAKIFKDINMNINNLAELYNTNSKILSNYKADIIFLPWTHFKPSKYKDINFKVFYNQEYQYLQFKKIFDLNWSMIKYGYLPEKFPTRQGGISGYFLIKDNKKVFYVVSGNHRVAVLSSLFPKKKIPVVFENIKTLKKRDVDDTILEKSRVHPEYFSYEGIANWPSVKSGFINENCAKVIFLNYFKEENSIDFKEKNVGIFQNPDKIL